MGVERHDLFITNEVLYRQAELAGGLQHYEFAGIRHYSLGGPANDLVAGKTHVLHYKKEHRIGTERSKRSPAGCVAENSRSTIDYWRMPAKVPTSPAIVRKYSKFIGFADCA